MYKLILQNKLKSTLLNLEKSIKKIFKRIIIKKENNYYDILFINHFYFTFFQSHVSLIKICKWRNSLMKAVGLIWFQRNPLNKHISVFKGRDPRRMTSLITYLWVEPWDHVAMTTCETGGFWLVTWFHTHHCLTFLLLM